MIQITLDEKKGGAASSDPLKRSKIGWSDGLYDRQLHDIARGVWVMRRDHPPSHGDRLGCRCRRWATGPPRRQPRPRAELTGVGRPSWGKGLLLRKLPSSLLSAAAKSASPPVSARTPDVRRRLCRVASKERRPAHDAGHAGRRQAARAYADGVEQRLKIVEDPAGVSERRRWWLGFWV